MISLDNLVVHVIQLAVLINYLVLVNVLMMQKWENSWR